MKFDQFLGKSIESVRSELPDHSIEQVYDHVECSEDQEYYLRAQDGCWEIPLHSSDIVETIFLYYKNGFERYANITIDMGKDQLISMLGDPVYSGEPSNHAVLGEKGGWEKFRVGGHFLHVEHIKNYDGIKMVTLMILGQGD